MIELHSRDVPPAERFEWYCELLSRDMAPHHIASDHAADFPASALQLPLHEVRLSGVEFPSLRSVRTRRLIQRADPELWELALIARGSAMNEQGRNHVDLRAGDLVLYDTSQPYRAVCGAADGMAQVIVLHLPRRTLPVPEQSLRRLVATPLPSRTGSGLLLGRLLAGLVEQAAVLGGTPTAQLGAAVLELAVAFLAGLAGAEEPPTAEARQAALLHRIKAFVRGHLQDPALSPSSIAAAHHISPRTLHYLFRQDGRTVGEFVREQRLERCRADLADPRLARRSVAVIGARWGFSDAAVFTRAFKARHGMPPGEYRRRHARPRD